MHLKTNKTIVCNTRQQKLKVIEQLKGKEEIGIRDFLSRSIWANFRLSKVLQEGGYVLTHKKK